jgi:hypothetical protein
MLGSEKQWKRCRAVLKRVLAHLWCNLERSESPQATETVWDGNPFQEVVGRSLVEQGFGKVKRRRISNLAACLHINLHQT